MVLLKFLYCLTLVRESSCHLWFEFSGLARLAFAGFEFSLLLMRSDLIALLLLSRMLLVFILQQFWNLARMGGIIFMFSYSAFYK